MYYSGALTVNACGAYTKQEYITMGSQQQRFFRMYESGTWGNWEKINTNSDLAGTANVMLMTSSIQAGSNFFTNSFYVPNNLQVKINIVNVFGADGNFKDNFAVNRSGSYVSFYTTNSNLGGKTCTFNITIK